MYDDISEFSDDDNDKDWSEDMNLSEEYIQNACALDMFNKRKALAFSIHNRPQLINHSSHHSVTLFQNPPGLRGCATIKDLSLAQQKAHEERARKKKVRKAIKNLNSLF